MVLSYKKGERVKLSPHFDLYEFHCRCVSPACTHTLVDTELILALEELHGKVGPIHINDAFRCPSHNKSVGGALGSQHPLGKAADIRASVSISALYTAVLTVEAFELGGVGRYNAFIHVDVRGHKARWEG